MTSSHPAPAPCHWFSRLAAALDRRSASRLAWLLFGAVLARGRRTVTSWIRATGLGGEYHPCYTAVSAAGKGADFIAARLVHGVVKPLVAGAARGNGDKPDWAGFLSQTGASHPQSHCNTLSGLDNK